MQYREGIIRRFPSQQWEVINAKPDITVHLPITILDLQSEAEMKFDYFCWESTEAVLSPNKIPGEGIDYYVAQAAEVEVLQFRVKAHV